jgi:hypothetical protein
LRQLGDLCPSNIDGADDEPYQTALAAIADEPCILGAWLQGMPRSSLGAQYRSV